MTARHPDVPNLICNGIFDLTPLQRSVKLSGNTLKADLSLPEAASEGTDG
jgi:hypothetical protein